MWRHILIGTIAVFLGILLIVGVVRRRQVWIGHERIHNSSVSYAGEFSSFDECRREVEKYGGSCSSRCTWTDNVRWDDCKLTVPVAPNQQR
jgi:hypothetical protein